MGLNQNDFVGSDDTRKGPGGALQNQTHRLVLAPMGLCPA